MESLRKTYNIEDKINIVKRHLASGDSIHLSADNFGINRHTLREWIQNVDQYDAQKDKISRRYIAYTRSQPYAFEAELYDYIIDFRSQAKLLTSGMISAQISLLDANFKSDSDGALLQWIYRSLH